MNKLCWAANFLTWAERWIGVIGILAVVLSFYYFYSARQNDFPFFRISVVGWVWFSLAMTALALFNLGGLMLIGFRLVDLLATGWTLMAFRAQGEWKL
jgi:hypothetical protein